MADWKKRIVHPDRVIEKIKPGMSIFLSTGIAEPRTLVRHLLTSEWITFKDVELVQLISLGDLIVPGFIHANRYRLKTFFSGWKAGKAIHEGLVDLIPGRFSGIPDLMESGRLTIDAAFLQISPPDAAGFCSLGPAVDVARRAMAQASLVVGEVNRQIPRTYGDTHVPVSDFHYLVDSQDPPIYLDRCPVDDVSDRVAAHAASVIEDGSCLAFSVGTLYEALGRHLKRKKDLGVHSPFFTDAVMDLVKSGAITNRFKESHRGISLTSYAVGSPELLAWLDCNPLVEFHPIDAVFDPSRIARNRRFVAVLPARKVDLSGRVVLSFRTDRLSMGPEEAIDIFTGAELSPGGKTIFALPSRDESGDSNIRISVERFQDQFPLREAVDVIVTEYGVVSLAGKTLRERAQAMIDIAHPDDRAELVDRAKKKKIIYPDQVFIAECARLYPEDLVRRQVFGEGLAVRFRAIKPSDEEGMRRLFYRFSDEAVFYRYFSPIKTMPHEKMQEYVNADCNMAVSIVGEIGEADQAQIIAEARIVKLDDRPFAEAAFVVDEKYHGLGIATYLFKMLIRLAKERGLKGLTADVLPDNRSMMKVFEKGGYPVNAKLMNGIYQLTISFESALSD